VARAEAYLHVRFHLDPSNRLATVPQRHRHDRQDRQRSDSIGRRPANRFTNGRPKMAEPIEMPFGLRTAVSPRKHILGGGAHWRKLAYTTELSMCGGDAACCQITLITCYFMWLISACAIVCV